jgi:hypothetical protein
VLWRGVTTEPPGGCTVEAGEPYLEHTPALHHVEVLLRNAVDARFMPVDAAAAPPIRGLRIRDPHDAACRRVRETTA